MLLGNFNQFNKNPGRAIGGPSDPTRWFKAGSMMHFYSQNPNEVDVEKSSFPNGYTPPYSWVLAPTAGGISTSLVSGSGSVSTTLYGAKFMVGPLAGSGSISDANTSLIVNAIATLTASGAISSAGLNATAQMTTTLAATGDLVGALTALGHIVATLNAAGSLSATNYAIGHISATIGDVSTSLTAAQVAEEVWNSVASDFNTAGTMGEKINTSTEPATDPWDANLNNYSTPDTAGKKLKDLQNILPTTNWYYRS